MPAIKHVGLSVNRLSREPKEKAFYEAWAYRATGTLYHLLNPGESRPPYDLNYSQRDATVAATVIQWLGSPIGEQFIDQVRARKDYKDYKDIYEV